MQNQENAKLDDTLVSQQNNSINATAVSQTNQKISLPMSTKYSATASSRVVYISPARNTDNSQTNVSDMSCEDTPILPSPSRTAAATAMINLFSSTSPKSTVKTNASDPLKPKKRHYIRKPTKQGYTKSKLKSFAEKFSSPNSLKSTYLYSLKSSNGTHIPELKKDGVPSRWVLKNKVETKGRKSLCKDESYATPLDASQIYREYNRKEKSLGLLCEKFLNLYRHESNSEISLDDAAGRLGVERRRIYDIVNILESIHLVSRKSKNLYTWHGLSVLPITIKDMKASYDSQVNVRTSLESSTLNMSSSKDRRRGKSLSNLSQMFVQLFLREENCIIPLHEAAQDLIEMEKSDNEENQLLKTKVRRLYDVANVLVSVGLIEKVQLTTHRKPVFRWRTDHTSTCDTGTIDSEAKKFNAYSTGDVDSSECFPGHDQDGESINNPQAANSDGKIGIMNEKRALRTERCLFNAADTTEYPSENSHTHISTREFEKDSESEGLGENNVQSDSWSSDASTSKRSISSDYASSHTTAKRPRITKSFDNENHNLQPYYNNESISSHEKILPSDMPNNGEPTQFYDSRTACDPQSVIDNSKNDTVTKSNLLRFSSRNFHHPLHPEEIYHEKLRELQDYMQEYVKQYLEYTEIAEVNFEPLSLKSPQSSKGGHIMESPDGVAYTNQNSKNLYNSPSLKDFLINRVSSAPKSDSIPESSPAGITEFIVQSNRSNV